MLSVIIPSRNEIYLEKTIRNILENAQGDIEVIAELDGYVPDPQIIIDDPRVKFVHHPTSIGQRACINHGVSIASGKFIMKLDAHCAVALRFDVELAKNCEESWTVVPRMYNLDIHTWKPKLHKLTDYMYFTSPNDPDKPFRAAYYEGREYRRQHKNPEIIDDTMCCMGPGWFMHKKRFLEQGGCDEFHEGGWGQQGIEVSLKAWLSGGALKVNKNTWFAHWFRGGGGPGFPYHLSGNQVERVRDYSKDLWLNDKWPLATRKLSWVIEKFRPPTWDEYVEPNENEKKNLFVKFYRHMIKPGKNVIRWRGHRVLKLPSDLALYQQAIFEKKPDFIVETGTKWGGSAIFLADMCELNGHGQVITVDIAPLHKPEHPRITYITGNSIDKAIVEQIKGIVGDKSVMVILDSDHSFHHVMWELHRYNKLVTLGQYLVVEDCHNKYGERHHPMDARDWFLKRTGRFKLEDFASKYLVGLSMDGWLLRK
ncbi:glycosyltransferase [Candidatus Parcubacteria bacterium]|nr:glycosyltransferase [Candidatus Parcubacteria bacterium]